MIPPEPGLPESLIVSPLWQPHIIAMTKEKTYHICTWDDPWTPTVDVPTQHPEAFTLSVIVHCDQEYGIYFCPACQRKFTELVPR